MKRYRFRLANVLRVRRIEEEKAALALAAARRHAELAAQEAQEAADGYVGRTTARSRAVTATFLAQRSLAEASAASVITLRRQAAQALVDVDERRADWTVAAGRVTGLEKLDERRRDEHEIELIRAEHKTVDDVVTSRHGRKDES